MVVYVVMFENQNNPIETQVEKVYKKKESAEAFVKEWNGYYEGEYYIYPMEVEE